MAAFDYAQNLYDVALKPRLLRSLINEHIPEDKQPLGDSLRLLHVASAIRTHELLSERVVPSADNKKLIEKWKSAVDLWVDRVLMLVFSKMPDKAWAGISLLGVTFEVCSSERFLASYSVWFQELLKHIQASAGSNFVKLACCSSISDFLTRLSGFPNMKRDGSSHAAKLLQPVLKLIQEDSSEAEGAVTLLCTILTLFPSSLQKNYDSAEAAIVTKLMSGKCNTDMVKKLALCLSLLPKSRGDADSWYLMIQKILIAVNVLLNDSFQGLEEETKTMRALVSPGKDPPTPLGGITIFDLSNKSTKPERVSMGFISSLMLCCSTMLTSSYPAQAKVPVQLLLMLVKRVLMVDGSLTQTLYPIITAMQQEYVCLELPVQHTHCLDILCGIVKEAHSQLLPHAARIIRIVTEYLRKCELPELRVKVYALLKLMLLSMGVGLSLYLAEDIVLNASTDLDSVGDRGDEARSNSESTQKKRKREMTVMPFGDQAQTVYLPKNPIPIALKIAALEVLETLLTVGGASGSDSWRSSVDSLVINVATDACKGGWIKSANDFHNSHNSSSNWADFQLASLRALLASLLSPGRIRPPYLAHGLELYRKGKQETGTKIAEFCAHALMALELLIHPRAIPLIDFGSSIEYPVNGVKNRFTENYTYSGAQNHNVFSVGASRNEPENPESEEDDLYDKWVKDNDGNQPPAIEQENNETTPQLAEKVVSVEVSSGAEVVPENKGKGILVETPSVEEVKKQTEIQSQTVDFKLVDNMVTGDPDPTDKTPVSGPVGGMESKFDLGDNDDPMDEIPDIVDVEPDSSDEE
ncbi:putative pre-rRNA-processing protein RIX1 [Helianthus debilis subsp. tardiflorus]